MISDNGAVRVPVPLTADYKFDLDAMRAAITDKTKLAIIVNPNNPTGTCVSGAQIEAFIRGLPDHVIPVVDEAYIEFTNSDETYSMLKLINEGYDRPLIVLRTFSKIYGLAGLRVGYCIAPPEIIDEMNKIDQAWNMSKLSQAAAVEAMKDQDYIKMVKEKTILNRKYLVDGLRDLGCEVADSVTNFIYFRSPIEPKELVKIMNELAIRGVNIESIPKGANQVSKEIVETSPLSNSFNLLKSSSLSTPIFSSFLTKLIHKVIHRC